MANPKLVWVKPTGRGQLASGRFVEENGPPFQVAENKVSKRWMKLLTPAEIKALAPEPAGEVSDSEVDRLTAELAAMTAERDKMDAAGKALTEGLAVSELARNESGEALAAMTAERDALKTAIPKVEPSPPIGIAGAKKVDAKKA